MFIKCCSAPRNDNNFSVWLSASLFSISSNSFRRTFVTKKKKKCSEIQYGTNHWFVALTERHGVQDGIPKVRVRLHGRLYYALYTCTTAVHLNTFFARLCFLTNLVRCSIRIVCVHAISRRRARSRESVFVRSYVRVYNVCM